MITGHLERRSLADLLQQLHEERFTGELDLHVPTGLAQIFLQDGLVGYVHLPQAGELLGRVLVEIGALSEAAHRRSLAIHPPPGQRYGDMLTKLGLCDEASLIRGLRAQIVRRVQHLLTQNQGRYTAVAGPHDRGMQRGRSLGVAPAEWLAPPQQAPEPPDAAGKEPARSDSPGAPRPMSFKEMALRRAETEAKSRITDPEALKAELCFARGLVLLKERDYDDALQELGEAARLKPDHGEYVGYRHWARFCAGKARADECLMDMARALKSAPESAPLFYFTGVLCKESGNDEKALLCFARAQRLDRSMEAAATEIRLIKSRMARGTRSITAGQQVIKPKAPPPAQEEKEQDSKPGLLSALQRPIDAQGLLDVLNRPIDAQGIKDFLTQPVGEELIDFLTQPIGGGKKSTDPPPET